MSELETDLKATEMAEVVRRRRGEALEAGLSWDDANEYAGSEVGTEELRHLVELHCPPTLLARILL